jgi:hypothetical protein
MLREEYGESREKRELSRREFFKAEAPSSLLLFFLGKSRVLQADRCAGTSK